MRAAMAQIAGRTRVKARPAWRDTMSKKIQEIEGIGPAMAEKLAGAGISTVEQLLAEGGTKAGRDGIATKSGLDASVILTWVNKSDLFRIKGIGEEYSDLLVAAGVDTVPELAQRNAANLTAKMAELNDAKKLVRALPSEGTVAGWIAQAKELPKAVHH
jgi:predicted flap endonuclease-1-like 5' DNA nuclease